MKFLLRFGNFALQFYQHHFMIQRIQTVYLMLAALLGLSSLMVPVWRFSFDNETELVNALQMYSPLDADGSLRSRWFFLTPLHIGWVVFLALTTILIVYTIFQYKDRLKQIRLCWFALIGQGLQILSAMLLIMNGPHWIMGGKANLGSPFIGFGLMAISLILIWMAAKAIRKDENLVKSVDRLR